MSPFCASGKVTQGCPSNENESKQQCAAKTVLMVSFYESREQFERVIERMLPLMQADESVSQAIGGLTFTVGFTITDLDSTFVLRSEDRRLTGQVGADPAGAQIRLATDSQTFDGVFSDELDPMGAVMYGRIAFAGDLGLGVGLLGAMDALKAIYAQARAGNDIC